MSLSRCMDAFICCKETETGMMRKALRGIVEPKLPITTHIMNFTWVLEGIGPYSGSRKSGGSLLEIYDQFDNFVVLQKLLRARTWQGPRTGRIYACCSVHRIIMGICDIWDLLIDYRRCARAWEQKLRLITSHLHKRFPFSAETHWAAHRGSPVRS